MALAMASEGPSVKGANLTYASSGVDIDAGNRAVERIKALVASTRRPEQLDDIGGFAGMIAIPPGYREPVLVSGADGVGTKLLVAIACDRHDTVGIDLVAMCVNDLIVTGADPLFLLDYIATGVLSPAKVEAIVSGIVDGCRQAGCSLIGGETAELPGMYAEGHYDLAATATGVVERSAILGPGRVVEGDVVLALPSSGLHSNGYSLARKALLDPAHGNLTLDAPLPTDPSKSVGQALLTPTIIYQHHFEATRSVPGALHAAAHITGGGLIENPPRVLPPGLAMTLDLGDVEVPAVQRAVAQQGVSLEEQRRTFNCGVGMMLVVDAARAAEVCAAVPDALQIGRVHPRDNDRAVCFRE